jgi:hypothetical protein
MVALKRLIFAVAIFTVIVVMALRGCPRVRKRAGMAHDLTAQSWPSSHFGASDPLEENDLSQVSGFAL